MRLLVSRSYKPGLENTNSFRGGTWYTVGPNSPYKGIGTVGGLNSETKTLNLKNPFFVDITGVLFEYKYPLIMYEAVLHNKPSSKGLGEQDAEVRVFSPIERKVSAHLLSRGYDSVVFYTNINRSLQAKEVFLLSKSSHAPRRLYLLKSKPSNVVFECHYNSTLDYYKHPFLNIKYIHDIRDNIWWRSVNANQ